MAIDGSAWRAISARHSTVQQLLVKEVNHRVNDSLSIVASMLHLHAS